MFYRIIIAVSLLGLFACNNASNETAPQDKTPPEFVSITPEHVSENDEIFIKFSEELDPSTVRSDNVRVYLLPEESSENRTIVLPAENGLEYIPGDKIIRFQPNAPFLAEREYMIELRADGDTNNGLKDSNGNVLVSNQGLFYVATFTTMQGEALSPLVISGRTPGIDATEVGVYEVIKITFSNNLDEATVHNDTIKVYEVPSDGGQLIPIAPETNDSNDVIGITYSDSEKTIRFKPNEYLSSSTKYKVEIISDSSSTLGIRDIDGNAVDPSEIKSWIFNTASNVTGRLALRSIFPLPNDMMEEPTATIDALIDQNIVTNPRIDNDVISASYSLPGESVEHKLPGEVSYDDGTGTISFRPKLAAFPYGTTIHASIELFDSNGTEVISRYDWTFSVREVEIDISENKPLDTLAELFSYETMVDHKGNVTVTWFKKNGDNFDLVAKRYNNITRIWQNDISYLENLNSTDTPYITHHVIDTEGNITLLWHQNQKYWLTRYDITQGWLSDNTSISPKEIISDSSLTSRPDLLVDKFGNITVIWAREETPSLDFPQYNDIYAARFEPSNAQWDNWNPQPKLIENQNATLHYSITPISKIDSNGNITVIWVQGQSLWATRFEVDDNGQGSWQSDNANNPPEELYNSYTDSSRPRVSIDSFGNITLAWHKYIDSSNEQIYSARFNVQPPTPGWSDVFTLVTDYTDQIYNIRLVPLADGDTMAVSFAGNQSNSAGYNFYTQTMGRWFNNDEGFPLSIENPDNRAKDFITSSLISNSGNAAIIWAEETIIDPSNRQYDILAKHYDKAEKRWIVSNNILDSDNSTNNYAVIHGKQMDSLGNITVVWRQISNTGNGQVGNMFASRYNADSMTWTSSGSTPPKLIDASNEYISHSRTEILNDKYKNVTILLGKPTSTGLVGYTSLLATRYTSSNGWANTTEVLDSSEGGNITRIEAVVDNSGQVTILWLKDGILYTNRYD